MNFYSFPRQSTFIFLKKTDVKREKEEVFITTILPITIELISPSYDQKKVARIFRATKNIPR